MNIPDEAVEAAALALLERDYGVRDWSIVTEQVKGNYLDEARTALEAAAPHLMAQAWDEGERVGFEESFRDNDPRHTRNPYRAEESGK